MNQAIRSLFPVTEKYIYMNHAAVSPLSVRARDSMNALNDDVTNNGAANYKDWLRAYESTRQSAARLVNAQAHEIAFMQNTSGALSAIANGIVWRENDSVVGCNVEFPSNVYPWMRLGIKLKKAPEREGRIDADELLSLVDDTTRVVAVSWVQFASGFRSDITRIGRFCRDRDIIFVVDAIQGLGGLALDVERDSVDAFAADAHKYLLGPEGVALMYVSDRVIDRIEPTVVGWTSVKNYEQFAHGSLDYDLDYRKGALRYECGTLNTTGVCGLGAAIDLFLEVGPEKIEEHILGLSDHLAESLKAKGYDLISSRRKGETSAIVCCTHKRHTSASLYHLLLEKNIITAHRTGRLRISPHFYNTREEIDTLVAALPE
ncbi:MAG: aminotransferase class V-fold PLP-dependent enzyme [Blastocatellia bacterium]